MTSKNFLNLLEFKELLLMGFKKITGSFEYALLELSFVWDTKWWFVTKTTGGKLR